jgi:hypothetical protein
MAHDVDDLKPLVHLVHGFNVHDGGKETIGKLKDFFIADGYFANMVNYGWIGLGGVAIKNPKIARTLVDIVGEGDIGVGHSNGCAILHQAACEGAKFKKLVFINPALDVSRVVPPHVEEIHVWHSPSDGPVRTWSQVERFLPFIQTFFNHPWGEMGAKGYVGEDPRYKNFNKESDFRMSSNAHSDMFDWDKISYFGREIVKKLR